MTDTCSLHKRVEEDIKDIEKKSREDHLVMWNDIKGKVPMKLFMWIIGLMVGFLLIVGSAQTKFAYDTSVSVTRLETNQSIMIEKLK